MELKFCENKGVGILQNPQQIDLSRFVKLCFTFDPKYNIMEINRRRYALENGRCEIKVRELEKGTNTIRAIGDTVLPCQPILVYDSYDKQYCTLATSIDVLEVLTQQTLKIAELEQRITALETENPAETRKTLNACIKLINQLQQRLIELENNYDPTII